MSVTERDSLDLTCNITTDRSGIFQAQVTWYFRESLDDTLSDARVLLSVDRDSVVSNSPLISLSHMDRNSYHLLVRDVGMEDSGYYFCQASVWVPQHNGSWHKVVEKTSSPVSMMVTALGEWLHPEAQQIMSHSFPVFKSTMEYAGQRHYRVCSGHPSILLTTDMEKCSYARVFLSMPLAIQIHSHPLFWPLLSCILGKRGMLEICQEPKGFVLQPTGTGELWSFHTFSSLISPYGGGYLYSFMTDCSISVT